MPHFCMDEARLLLGLLAVSIPGLKLLWDRYTA